MVDDAGWWGSGLEAVGALVVLTQVVLYGFPGSQSSGPRPGDRLQAWFGTMAVKATLPAPYEQLPVRLAFAGTTVAGLVAIGHETGTITIPATFLVLFWVIPPVLYVVAFLDKAPPVLRYMGRHLPLILSVAATVLTLGVVLQFADYWWDSGG